MPRKWADVERDRETYPDHLFQEAAYLLVTRQVLYRREPRQKSAYDLVCAHEKEFTEAMRLMGLALHVDALNAYVAVVPEVEVDNPFDLTTTLLMLVVRRLYHEQKLSGELRNGAAAVAVPDLVQSYIDMTGREIDGREAPLRDLMQPLKQSGLVRFEKISDGYAESQPFYIEVLPAVEHLVGEQFVERLAAHLDARTAVKKAAKERLAAEAPTGDTSNAQT
jgi:hypothetical protein